MDKKKLVVFSGALLAICATAGYLFLREKLDLSEVRESITERLGMLDDALTGSQ